VEGKRRLTIAKVAAACISVAAVLAIFFLVPVVPTRVTTYELYEERGWCVATQIEPAPFFDIYASPSYVLFHLGVVYVVVSSGVIQVPAGSYLWWLPSGGQSSKVVCI
jgi:hypothetical protein